MFHIQTDDLSTLFFDVHAHLADSRLTAQVSSIIKECQAQMQGVLVNAARLCEWNKVLQLAKEDKIYAALGLHPFFIDEWQENSLELLEQKLVKETKNSKILALGEIGLDFWNGREELEEQLDIFSQQLLLAQRLNLPVILHNRKGWPDFFSTMKNLRISELSGVCHHFTGSKQIAAQLLDMGLYISFCGPLTYESAKKLHKLAEYVPLERILTETDSPDLPPAAKRNEQSRPWMVKEIVEKIADLKKIKMETVQLNIANNWQRLFQANRLQ